MLKKLLGAALVAACAAGSLADVTVRNDLPGGYVDIFAVGTRYNLGDDGATSITTSIGNSLLPAGTHSVSNNGTVSVNNGGFTCFTNETIPSGCLAGGAQAIAVYWDDLYTYDRPKGQEDGVWVYETADTLYITWRLGHLNAGGQSVMQLQVFADGPIFAQMVYPFVDFVNGNYNNGANATVGYQAGGIGNDYQYSFNAAGSIPNGTVLSLVDPQAVPVTIVGTIAGRFRAVTSAATYFNLGDDSTTSITTDVGNLLLPPGTHTLSNNGAIAWGNGNSSAFTNAALPSAGLGGGDQALAVYWDDLFTYTRSATDRADGVYVEQTDNSLYVTWVLGHFDAGGQAMIQLQVFECGPVYAQYVYNDVDFINGNINNGGSATIGYQSGGLGGATQWSFNTPNSVRAGSVLSLVDAQAPECRADFNRDGVANSQDFFDFLTQFFAGCP